MRRKSRCFSQGEEKSAFRREGFKEREDGILPTDRNWGLPLREVLSTEVSGAEAVGTDALSRRKCQQLRLTQRE